MDEDTLRIITDVLMLGGYFLRALGLLVLGLGSGWLAVSTVRQAKTDWQVKAAVVLGLFYLSAAVVSWSTEGAVGAFSLGAGVAIFIWGLLQDREK
jgi:FtsH-binding integral membrane protein